MEKINGLLRKLFWVDRLEGKNKFLSFFSKAAMYFYALAFVLNLVGAIISLSIGNIISTIMIMILFPLMYRMVMKLQMILHGI